MEIQHSLVVLHLQECGVGWAGLGRGVVATEGSAVTLGSIPQSHPAAGVGVKFKKQAGTPPVPQFAIQTFLVGLPRDKITDLVAWLFRRGIMPFPSFKSIYWF